MFPIITDVANGFASYSVALGISGSSRNENSATWGKCEAIYITD